MHWGSEACLTRYLGLDFSVVVFAISKVRRPWPEFGGEQLNMRHWRPRDSEWGQACLIVHRGFCIALFHFIDRLLNIDHYLEWLVKNCVLHLMTSMKHLLVLFPFVYSLFLASAKSTTVVNLLHNSSPPKKKKQMVTFLIKLRSTNWSQIGTTSQMHCFAVVQKLKRSVVSSFFHRIFKTFLDNDPLKLLNDSQSDTGTQMHHIYHLPT